MHADLDALTDKVLAEAATAAASPDAGEPNARAIVLVIGILSVIVTLLVAAAVARRDESEPA